MTFIHSFLQFQSEKTEESKGRTGFWASDLESCRRALAYSFQTTKQSNPPSVQNELMFETGKQIEVSIVARFMEMRATYQPSEIVGDHIREDGGDSQVTYDESIGQFRIGFLYEGVPFSGKPDAIISDEGQKAVVEVKTFYGPYYERELKNNKPKTSHCLQLAFYLFALGLPKGYLFNMDRGSGQMYFNTMNHIGDLVYKCGDTIVELELALSRLHQCYGEIQSGLPDPDYKYKYDTNLLHSYLKDKTISKTKIVDAARGHSVVGDWQCKYCSFKDRCLQDNGISLGYTEEEMVSVKELSKILQK